ncbi:MAG TPA: sugar ABC transporter permease [Anaeromyxobacter sp.]|nr:sugar ABC transporter permease [Anaeromyxobacter sp.]
MWERLVWGLVAVAGVPLVLSGYVFAVERALSPFAARRRNALRPWLWLVPGVVLLAGFLIYPVVHTLVLSLFNATSTRFAGLGNYVHIFTERSMLTVLRNNLLWLLIFPTVTVVLGLVLAVLTDRVRYQWAVKAAIFVPMAISLVAAGVIWKFMYQYQPPGQPQTGTVNSFLSTLVPGFQPRAWLFDRALNNPALIFVLVWMWVGFAMVILYAALKGIDEALLEAARLEGATEFQIFFKITLPLMMPTVTVVTTTLVINVLKVFDVVYVMTNGSLGTDVIANRMYKEMFNYNDFGRASAFATLLLLAIIPVMFMNIKRFGRGGRA